MNMNSISKSSRVFLIGLVATFFVYLLTIRFAFMASAYVLIAIYMLIGCKPKRKLVTYFMFFFLINCCISLFVGFNWRETSLLMWLMLIIPLFQTGYIKHEYFLNFVNITYLFYLSLSILVSFHIIPAGFDPGHDILNQFDALLGESELKTLVGFGGSTADIDSYSVVVCLYNILLNSNFKYKVWMSIISGLAVILTFRFTPLLSAIFALFIVLSKNKRYLQLSRTIYLTLISMSFLVLLAFSHIDDLLFLVTHGRSEIWSIYVNIMWKDTFDKFLFGYREAHLPLISVSIWQEEFSNAHSSFLRIFMHWGIFVYVVFILYLLHLYFKTNNRKIIYLQSVIFTAAITNMNIFWNDNPIYFFILFYISYCYLKGEQIEQEEQVEQVEHEEQEEKHLKLATEYDHRD